MLMIIQSIEFSTKLFKWFTGNQIKGNRYKCHLIVSTRDVTEIQVGDSVIKNSTCGKLLDAKVNNNNNRIY